MSNNEIPPNYSNNNQLQDQPSHSYGQIYQHYQPSPVAKSSSFGWILSTIILSCLLFITISVIMLLLVRSMLYSGDKYAPVAIVNNNEISEDQLLNSLIDSYPNILIDEIDYLITYEVLTQEANAKGIILTKQDLLDELAAAKIEYGTEEEFQDYLDYYEMSAEDYMATLTIPTIRRLLLQQRISVTDKEIQTYFDQNKNEIGLSSEKIRASQIVVDDLQLAESILEQLNNGESFIKLAKKYSTDYSAQNGGDLGYIAYDDMIEEFSNIAFSLDINELSDIVSSYYGYHIILKTEYQKAIPAKFDDVEEAIRIKLINDKIFLNYSNYIDDLINKADVWSIVERDDEYYDESTKDTINPFIKFY